MVRVSLPIYGPANKAFGGVVNFLYIPLNVLPLAEISAARITRKMEKASLNRSFTVRPILMNHFIFRYKHI